MIAELDILDRLFATGEIARIIENITHFAICHCGALNAARLYKMSQRSNSNTSEYERQIKEYCENKGYIRTAATIKLDIMLAETARHLEKTLLQLTDDESEELTDFINNFPKDEGIDISLEKLLMTLKNTKEMIKMANITPRRDKNGRFHSLRHTSATLLLYGGVSIKQVQGRLGHGDIETTNKYLHVIEEANVEAANILGDMLNPAPKSDKHIKLA